MYQKIEKHKGIRALKSFERRARVGKRKRGGEKSGGGRGEQKKKHRKFLTSIIPDTRFPFKSPGHRYYRVKYASHFVHQLPR